MAQERRRGRAAACGPRCRAPTRACGCKAALSSTAAARALGLSGAAARPLAGALAAARARAAARSHRGSAAPGLWPCPPSSIPCRQHSWMVLTLWFQLWRRRRCAAAAARAARAPEVSPQQACGATGGREARMNPFTASPFSWAVIQEQPASEGLADRDAGTAQERAGLCRWACIEVCEQ